MYQDFMLLTQDNEDIHEANAAADAKIVNKEFSWFVETITARFFIQQLVADQMLTEMRTEKFYDECTLLRK